MGIQNTTVNGASNVHVVKQYNIMSAQVVSVALMLGELWKIPELVNVLGEDFANEKLSKDVEKCVKPWSGL